jgi:phenylacetate-coenzyme A ligase PaaK-like adenylate-forming protein
MLLRETIIENIFKVKDSHAFNELCLEIFAYQHQFNAVYQSFCNHLNRKPEQVQSADMIPFIPVELYKHHIVSSKPNEIVKIFRSSGTTGSINAQHFVHDLGLYEKSFLKCFELFFGDPKEQVIIGLLPSYLERDDASLVYMTQKLIEISGQKESGFYLQNYEALKNLLQNLASSKKKIWLIGVSFALLDLFEIIEELPDNLTIVETGGMKGKRREMLKTELHETLRNSAKGNWKLCGEYGMTELFSQAYALDGINYQCPPWMQVRIYDINDPFCMLEKNKTGAVHIIDLANLDTCSFIATQDLGRLNDDNSFEILGRFDNSDLRGCNLMVE